MNNHTVKKLLNEEGGEEEEREDEKILSQFPKLKDFEKILTLS